MNNAGYGVPGSYTNVPWADHQTFMQVMVMAVCDLTYRLLPGMVERGWGASSTSPRWRAWCRPGRPHAVRRVEGVLDSLRKPYRLETSRGVNVTAVCPGFTHSEFHDVLGTRDRMKMPAMLWLDAPPSPAKA